MSVANVTDTGEAILRVGPAHAAGLGRIARRLCATGDREVDDPAFLATARQLWEEVPAALRRAIREFRRDSGPHGMRVLEGLPVDEAGLPPTPSVRGSVQRTADVPGALLLLFAHGLGDPVAFRKEKSGAMVQDVVPVPGDEDVQGNVGSVLLSFHNENAFHAHRPDFVMLLCLRADHDGAAGLRTSCVRAAAAGLSEQSRRVLFQDEFITEPPPSFGTDGGAAEAHAVLTGAPDDPDVRVDFAATRPLTAAAETALADLAAQFEKCAHTLVLRPGDLAIVDNRVTVHGRTAFRPRYDGRDRWLQRTFALTDLRRSRDFRPGDGHVLIR